MLILSLEVSWNVIYYKLPDKAEVFLQNLPYGCSHCLWEYLERRNIPFLGMAQHISIGNF